jgi:hypothetical protein
LVEGMSVSFVHAYTDPRTLPLKVSMDAMRLALTRCGFAG